MSRWRAEAVVLEEHPLRWVVGSGHHSLTYAAEADGFLVESPATWYAGRRRWDVSPGYDRPDQNLYTGNLFGGDRELERANIPGQYLPTIPITQPLGMYLDLWTPRRISCGDVIKTP